MSGRLSTVVSSLVFALTLSGCVTVVQPAGGTPAPGATAGVTAAPGPTGAAGATVALPATPDASVSASAAPTMASTLDAGSSDGSIVFVKDGDVWIAAPDGSAARQLTTDGADENYHDPSQAPDGTVFALRGASSMLALDRVTGAPKAAAVALITLENGAEGLTVAPDGAHVAYTTTGYGTEIDPRFGTPTGTFIYGGTDIATLDGRSVPNAALPSMIFAAWRDASTLAVSDGVKLYVSAIGSDAQPWLDESDGCLIDTDCPAGQNAAANVSQPVASHDGRFVAYTYKPYFGDAGRVIAGADAGIDHPPTGLCTLGGQQDYSDTGSFAPDGEAFAYDDTAFDPSTFDTTVGQGIYVLELNTGAPDCGVTTARLAIPGGAQPDWGPLAP